MTGTPLYQRTITYDYGDAERNDLMKEVWSVTPYIVNVRTGAINSEEWRTMMEWCRETFGPEAWPIHGRPGRWQTGSATIHGETFMGFATELDLDVFSVRFGECVLPEREDVP